MVWPFASLDKKISRIRNFDAGKNGRRLRGVPNSQASINAQIRQYGRTVVARSRYLASNNPYAASAKEEFVSALVGSGIKPSSLVSDADLKNDMQRAWMEWTAEADADGLTDFSGMQAIIAAEMFEAGECFIRIRPRFESDGLSVPMQLQILPSEMLPLDRNENSNGRRIHMGIEFDGIGRRRAYHFLKTHPDASNLFGSSSALDTVAVPASEVLHLFRPARAGQIRGLPHTTSAIVKLALMDQYDDAELERKKTAALFAAFITRPSLSDDEHPLENADGLIAGSLPPLSAPDGSLPMEPGAMIDLDYGESVEFSKPADVGGSYEAFQYRTLLSIAAGFGVPYAQMTGDLRMTSYSSIRAGLVAYRRRIEAIQKSVMIHQFCRPVWNRWLSTAVLSQSVDIAPNEFVGNERFYRRVKFIPPRWEWVDPLKDRQAEQLAVDNGFKARSDVIESEGFDPEEVDARIAADKARADGLGLKFGASAAAPAPMVDDDEGEPPAAPAEDDENDDDE